MRLPLRIAANASSKFWKSWHQWPTSLRDTPESGAIVLRQSVSRTRIIRLWAGHCG